MKPEIKLKEKGYAVEKKDDKYHINLKDIWISFHYPEGISFEVWMMAIIDKMDEFHIELDGEIFIQTDKAENVIAISRVLFG